MGAQSGKDVLIKIEVSEGGTFETFAGLRATRLSLNADTVDVTTVESQGGWRELLVGAGVRSAAISGSGVFKDATSDARAREVFFASEAPLFQVIVPDFGTMEGAFQITAIEYSGSYDGEATYEVAMASAGALTFTGA
ncbi:MAG: phage major tail protein, TP901-1 family [Pseudomonadota bacterium]